MAKRSSSSGYLVSSEPSVYTPPPPSVRVTDKDLPAIKDWAVGKTYTVTMKVKMVHHAEGKEYSGLESDKNPKEHSAKLEIVSIKPADDEKK